MSEQQRMIIEHFLKPIARKVGRENEVEGYFELLATGLPYRPAPELEYRAERLLGNWSKMRMPSKRELRQAIDWEAPSEKVIEAREWKPDWERGKDGLRYRDGQPLLCDLPKEERLAVVDRVARKYPVGGRVLAQVFAKEGTS